MKRTLFISGAMLVASACARVSTNSTKLDPSLQLARTCPLGVKIYAAPDRIGSDYKEVALLNSTGQATYSDEAEMLESMREKAAKVGANGILLSGIDEPNAITKVAADVVRAVGAGTVQTDAERKGRAMAIYVPADSAGSVAACAKYKRPSKFRRILGF